MSALFKNLWLGDYSQGFAFWALLVPTLLTIKAIFHLLTLSNVIANPVWSSRLWLPLWILAALVVIPLMFWGTSRAIYMAATKFRGGIQSASLAIGIALLGWFTLQNYQQAWPVTKTMSELALKIEPYDQRLSIKQMGTKLELSGTLTHDSLANVKRLSAENIDTVVLNLEGGHLYQARALAKWIREHKLNTQVDKRCAGSCTLLFMAGEQRWISKQAEVAFHRDHDYFNGYRSEWLVERERRADRAYYRKRGMRPGYIEVVHYTQVDNAYLIPTLNTLLAQNIATGVL